MILEQGRLYLGRTHADEQAVAGAIWARLQPAPLDGPAVAAALDQLFGPGDGLDWQRVAAAMALRQGFSVISGGPGTGKTTTLVKVLALLLSQQPDMKIHLVAPTGKAADRMVKVLSARAEEIELAAPIRDRLPTTSATIHRLLRPDHLGRFRHHARQPLLTDCVVVDEASMVDLPLMSALVQALPAHARLLLLGDRYQLASVEAGSVLGDICGHGGELALGESLHQALCDCGALPAQADLPTIADEQLPPVAHAIAELRVSHRFGHDSGIGNLARWVNDPPTQASAEALADLLAAHGELMHWSPLDEAPTEAALAHALGHYRHYCAAPSAAEALARLERFRVLAALRRSPRGVESLNEAIEAALRQEGVIDHARADGHYPGRPILILENDPQQRLYNGDVGVIWPGTNGLRAYFHDHEREEGMRSLSPRQLPRHETVFAMTIHKSQGSEFDQVLLMLPSQMGPLLTRELLYTGITRARQGLALDGALELISAATRRHVQRSTGLAERLGWPPSD